MLLSFVIGTALLWIASAAFTAVHMRRAPIGVEDENGFRVLEDVTVPFNPAVRPTIMEEPRLSRVR